MAFAGSEPGAGIYVCNNCNDSVYIEDGEPLIVCSDCGEDSFKKLRMED